MTKTIMFTIGGLCAGGAILTAVLGGFGVPGGPAALVYPNLGYDGVAEISLSSSGMLAIALLVVGLATFIAANATAWKETGGY